MHKIKFDVKSVFLAAVFSVIFVTGGVYLWQKNSVGQPVEKPGSESAAPTKDNLAEEDTIKVFTPKPNQVVKSPLVITGEARGVWFFEGSFPVEMVDADGRSLGRFYAEAQGDWMTSDFVGFKSQLNFTKPFTQTGKLILEKDNPSGLPENAGKWEIPVVFEEALSRINFIVPENKALYKKQMTEFNQSGGADPLKTMKFISQESIIPFTTGIVLASAQAAAGSIETGGGPTKTEIAYLKIEAETAYVLLNIDLDGWAGVSTSIAMIHPLVEKTLLQFSEIKRVVFAYAPGDK